MIHKGSIVTVTATVRTEYVGKIRQCETIVHKPDRGTDATTKCLVRLAYDYWVGLVIGKTNRVSGVLEPTTHSYEDYDPGHLYQTTAHPVWLVEPLDTDRWFKPSTCLEADLEECA